MMRKNGIYNFKGIGLTKKACTDQGDRSCVARKIKISRSPSAILPLTNNTYH